MVLNPGKLAGQCGRLKCCLIYEHHMYKEMGKGLPKVGKRVHTPQGIGRVLDLDILRQRVRVQLPEGVPQVFAGHEVRSLNAVDPHNPASINEAPDAADAADTEPAEDPTPTPEAGSPEGGSDLPPL